MTDNPTQEQNSNTVSNPPAEATPTEHMIPKSRLDEVLSKNREMEQQLAQIQQERQQQEEARLAQQNEWQTLAEQRQSRIKELEQYETQAANYRQQIEAYNQADIARIPENKRHLVPDFGDPVKLREYLNKALSDLVETPKPTAPKIGGGTGSGGNTDAPALSANHQALADIAKNLGYEVDESRIADYAKNPPNTKTGE